MGTLLFRSLIILGLFTVSQSASSSAHAADAACAPGVLSPANASMVKKIVKAKDDDHPESVVSAPDHDKLTAADYAVQPTDQDGAGYTYATNDDTNAVLSIDFKDTGPNSVIAGAPDQDGFPNRKFSFQFQGRATQDIHLEILDNVEKADSHNMQANIYMFPRKVIPAISWPDTGTTYTVTLPTGEIETFDKKTHAMISGPMKEQPVDMNPNRFNRKHPQVSFENGNPKNVYFKNDSRSGGDLRDPNTTIVQGTKTCKVASSLLFNTASAGSDANGWVPQGNISFKFATDADFNAFLKTKCHMDFLN